MANGNEVISTILKHDAKNTSYKIALLRAINDVALAFPDVNPGERKVAIPLRVLAEYWIAYYWPFVDSHKPIPQGQIAARSGGLSNDMAFRPALTQLRQAWEEFTAVVAQPADGFVLINELRVPRRRLAYPQSFLTLYHRVIKAITHSLRMPIRYAGPEQWAVFEPPQKYGNVVAVGIVAIPGTQDSDLCIVVGGMLWQSFQELSLWIEALAVHEWCLFSERVQPIGAQREGVPMEHTQPGRLAAVGRGDIYELLTARPDNRRPLTWERNQIDLLILEGKEFVCPWTLRTITQRKQYAVDHLVPVSIYPTNELWNLVPADAHFNSHVKGNRLPGQQKLETAIPCFALAYAHYQASAALDRAMHDDVKTRFAHVQAPTNEFAGVLAQAVGQLIQTIRNARNLQQF